MQSSAASQPNTIWANSSTRCLLTKQTQTCGQTCLCAMLFVWNRGGNLCIIWLWFISVENWKWGEGVFRSHTLGPSALPDWPYNITHCINTHCGAGSELRGRLCNDASSKHCVLPRFLYTLWMSRSAASHKHSKISRVACVVQIPSGREPGNRELMVDVELVKRLIP